MGDSFIIAIDFGTAYSGYAFNITPRNQKTEPCVRHFCCFKAGIVTKGKEDKLVIALEPEAASVYCKKLPSDGFIAENLGDGKLDQSPGTQYIVVDCGGGTIDITFHEVLEEGNLKELHKASGNDLGGQTVDRKFKQFLQEIFTGVWDDYEKKFPNEAQKIMYDFTLFKKHEDDVEIPCPFNLGKLAEKKKKIEKYFKKVHGATWEDGSIKISKEKLREFFEESLQGITRCLREILEKDFKIKYILLVGGYADSKILRNHITDEFGDDYIILCPFRPQEVIMKGAVEFGRNKGVVASRKNPFTYGVGIFQRFDKFRHREDKKFTNKDGVWCRDIFMKLVDVGEDVRWNETREHTLYPVEAAQKAMSFSFYRTKKKHVAYIDEPDTEEIGSFIVESPDTTLGLNREIRLKIKFGFTEMTATGTDRESGSSQTIRINFMRN
ncbi:heat shock 70 kDa protein 12A-like [Xiphophorus couchianus]|uniref:heat shock 70 kDa protein 12A-like n=1 Tax=Xiphophorus couchianus TaxID=32473 RepID=UPI001016185D|nr:heat shock 70 kDa protein 12A-like [Xiphophorus couchianus]